MALSRRHELHDRFEEKRSSSNPDSSSCSLYALSFWFSHLVLCVCSLSICAHTISSHGFCSALRPLRGLLLLFFVSSLFLVCPSCSLCALSLFGLPLSFFVCALSLSLYLCAHHIFTWALLCTSTTPRFAPLVLCVCSLYLCAHHIFTWALLCTSTTLRFAPLVLCVSSLF